MMLLQASQITKHFGHRTVLNGLDLNVQPGEVITIFGPNGAGKTTLIQILSTLIKPTSGTLQIGGVDALAEALRVRPSLGLVVHEPLAYLEFSPYENLKFFGRLYELDGLEQRIADLLERGSTDLLCTRTCQDLLTRHDPAIHDCQGTDS